MKKKIKHPFSVPDNFFDEFKHEIAEKLEKTLIYKENIMLKIVLQSLKYAAIFVFSFLLGRESYRVLDKQNRFSKSDETYSVEEIYSQVSEEELTEFILENITPEKLKQIKF